MLSCSGRSKAASRPGASQAASRARVGAIRPRNNVQHTPMMPRSQCVPARSAAVAVKAQGEPSEQNSPGDFAHDASMAGADTSHKVRSEARVTVVHLSSSFGGIAAQSVCCAAQGACLYHALAFMSVRRTRAHASSTCDHTCAAACWTLAGCASSLKHVRSFRTLMQIER